MIKRFVTVICLFVGLCGCASQESLYKRAILQGSIEQYELYLQQYPNGKYALEIRQKLEIKAFEQAKMNDTANAYGSFIRNFPNSRFKDEASHMHAYKISLQTDTVEGYHAFLERWPNSSFIQDIQCRIKYKKASAIGTEDVYREFIKSCPQSPLKNYAQAFLSFQNVKTSGSIQELGDFITKYPNTDYAAKAKKRVELLSYKQAMNTGSMYALKEFLEHYPQSNYAQAVEDQIDAVDPTKNFTPKKYFLFKLSNHRSPDLDRWEKAYSEYFYKKAKKNKYSGIDDYAPYISLAPFSPHLSTIYVKLFKKGENIIGFERHANFAFFQEYQRRFPEGKYINTLTPEQILENELRYLKTIYVSKPVARVIKMAKQCGVNANALAGIKELEKEILTFENLDINSKSACRAFFEAYPNSPQIELIREFHFKDLYDAYLVKLDPSYLEQLIFWLPKTEAHTFYTNLWDKIQQDINGRSSLARLKILDPLLMTKKYKFNTLDEIIFLTDLLSMASYIHLDLKETGRFALSNLVAAAIIHEAHRLIKIDMFKMLNEALGNFKDLRNMQIKMEKAKNKISKGINNIRSGQQMLNLLGVAGYFFGTIDFVNQINKIQSMDQADKEVALEVTKDKLRRIADINDPYIQNMHRLLSQILTIDPDSWPSLQAFILSPDKTQIDKIVLMPRFYDYADNIEEYLKLFKKDAEAISNKWLKDPNATPFQKARAIYIKGVLKKSISQSVSVKKSDLGDYGYFLDYYQLRTEKGSQANKTSLAEVAAEKNRIALILYTKIQGKTLTPNSLKEWLIKEIETKKYKENEAIHIFNPVIENLSESDKLKIVNDMFNSYNIEWADIAAIHF